MKPTVKDPGAAASGPAVDTLRRLLKGKADSFEIFFSHEEGFGVEAKGAEIDSLKVRSNTGVGLRTISNKKLGFGFSSVLTGEALEGLVGSALSGSLEASPDEYLVFPPESALAPGEEGLGIFDGSFKEVAEEEKIKTALMIEKSAMGFDARVKRVRKASYSETLHTSRIVNSNGVDITHRATFYSASVTAVAEENGESQMGWEIGMGHDRASIDPEEIGRRAGKNACRSLGARSIKTVRCPAVIENTVACELLEALAGSFLGDNVQKGKSMLIGKAGKDVASSLLNIWDDGVMAGGWATSSFDGEGAPREKTPLLDRGVLTGYLYDTYWGKRAGGRSTGNASRSNFKGLPGIGISNLYIEKGEKPLEGLLREIDSGLFITELLGVHTINTVNGDFSLGAAGFMVEGGKAAYPVRGMAVSGNLLELFLKVGGLGADIRFIGSIGAPSLLITELEASGT
ncbi:MAG: TldD/PmbA family protein [Deltaproteobacteria bacterium]|nr:TldD/PmbA family protein [Deltaproteobacteria bacterium]